MWDYKHDLYSKRNYSNLYILTIILSLPLFCIYTLIGHSSVIGKSGIGGRVCRNAVKRNQEGN